MAQLKKIKPALPLQSDQVELKFVAGGVDGEAVAPLQSDQVELKWAALSFSSPSPTGFNRTRWN